MSKPLDVDDKRLKFLLKVGQTVIVEGSSGSARNPLKDNVPVTCYNSDNIIDVFSSAHGHIISEVELKELPLKDHKKKAHVARGTHGIVVSHFWTEFTDKKMNEKNEEVEEISFETYCLVMIDDQFIVVPFRSLSTIYGK
jgi:hypothetical protein